MRINKNKLHKKESNLYHKDAKKIIFLFFTFLPFVAWSTDWRTKHLQHRCSSIYEGNLHKKKLELALSQLVTDKIVYPPKRGIWTDIFDYRNYIFLENRTVSLCFAFQPSIKKIKGGCFFLFLDPSWDSNPAASYRNPYINPAGQL